MRELLDRQSFEILHCEGLYLELLALWRQRYPYSDPLAGPAPLRRHLPLLGPLMGSGRWLPQVAFDMVFVARRQSR